MVEKPTYEATGLGKNGEEFPIRLEARNIPYKGKQVRTVEFRDITEQKKAEMEREKTAGLATIYGIVKQNSGFINVYSETVKNKVFYG